MRSHECLLLCRKGLCCLLRLRLDDLHLRLRLLSLGLGGLHLLGQLLLFVAPLACFVAQPEQFDAVFPQPG